VDFASEGDNIQKEMAAGALWVMSVNAENKAMIASFGARYTIEHEKAASALWHLVHQHASGAAVFIHSSKTVHLPLKIDPFLLVNLLEPHSLSWTAVSVRRCCSWSLNSSIQSLCAGGVIWLTKRLHPGT